MKLHETRTIVELPIGHRITNSLLRNNLAPRFQAAAEQSWQLDRVLWPISTKHCLKGVLMV